MLQVNPRLDGEADAGNHHPGIVGLQVVQVDAIVVDLGPEAVPQPVAEGLAIARFFNVVPGDPVHLPPLHGDTIFESSLQPFKCQVSGLDDRVEHPLMLLGHPGP